MADKKKLISKEIDILVVAGWQRLIPDWLIDHVEIAVLGGHGSAEGITAGRGRSPQNWALIMGKEHFTISLFRIDSGVDTGPVLLERTFNYSDFDDIQTSYFKTSWLMSDMLVELLSSLGTVSLRLNLVLLKAALRASFRAQLSATSTRLSLQQ